ncbi:MAG: glutamine-hydrolyzing carbamoyl-phosphate synthase small subunit [Proteobacteria bacterium]|nr:glutamine-hydrolyzing carbamoyl-phosphate synthase small subunit [Pseudomonadota bacterium]
MDTIFPFSTYKKAVLILETGDYFPGLIQTDDIETSGILCFNTAMTGYQEAISDPSYSGQLLVFSFPHIGNVGTNPEDMESSFPFLQGIIMGDLITEASNYRSTSNFLSWLKKNNIPCLEGVDTRTLVQVIRDYKKPLKGIIYSYTGDLTAEKILKLQEKEIHKDTTLEQSFLHQVSTRQVYPWIKELPKLSEDLYALKTSSSLPLKIVVVDFGVKYSTLKSLTSFGAEVIVVPFSSSYEKIIAHHPHGIVFSNGPGDPRFVDPSIFKMMEKLLQENLPLLGICLGHQLLSLIHNAEIIKLNCGHHGINHPVQDLHSKNILITSQNHEYAVKESSLPKCLTPTYRSLFDGSLEGYRVKEKLIFSIQFHPEAGPGPQDATFILSDFLKIVHHHAQKN